MKPTDYSIPSAEESEKPVSNDSDTPKNSLDRRKFVEIVAASAIGFTIVPRHVLGGKNYIAPSDVITLAYVGIGTQGIRELLPMLASPRIRVVAVCDPNKDAVGYKDWDIDGLNDEIRKAIRKPDWQPGGDNTIPGGRENGKSIVDNFYANVHPELSYKGCTMYADYRELLDKEKNVDAIKIITPDHLHGLFSMAAIKRGKHVLVQKPISNRLNEGKKLIQMARESKVITHLIPWDHNGSMTDVMGWINAGAIGNLVEIHNWTNRPVWPQYAQLPEPAAVPPGLNWDLWLGPEADRPYSPNYTNMVFRGWYDFGGGSMADMGHYSLWVVFKALQLTSPTIIEPSLSHVCAMHDPVPYEIENNYSFPMASSVRFKYPANGARPALDLCWYDGGMRPPIPMELLEENKELPEEGMMFVGDKGKILAGFNIQNPQIISGNKMQPAAAVPVKSTREERAQAALTLFADACKSGNQYPGNFVEAEYITEAVNLYALALRSRRMLKYDSANAKITNYPEANAWLSRNYRKGWELDSI
jgi:Oxidoreductase family, NAD-binding Rossmann fold/Oxidoreductase family, C-terminal alpha/beta domain